MQRNRLNQLVRNLPLRPQKPANLAVSKTEQPFLDCEILGICIGFTFGLVSFPLIRQETANDHLPHIVKQAREPDILHLLRVEAHLPAYRDRILHDALGVAARVGVLGVYGAGKGGDRADKEILQPVVETGIQKSYGDIV